MSPKPLGIYCPTYKRPHKLQEVADNIKATTKTDFRLYWGCEPEDRESIMAAADTGYPVIVNKGKQGYSDTIQTVYEQSDEPIFFHANDDFVFLDGWDIEPMRLLAENPNVMVVGAHDGNDFPTYWTISFIRRQYIEDQSGVVDMPNRVFFPYKHNYQDTEFSQTAIMRAVWVPCTNGCIKHLRLEHDETYAKNEQTAMEDYLTYTSRLALFQ